MVVNYKRFCDGDCNHCPLIDENKGTRELTYILNITYEKFGDEFYKLLNKTCPNLTVCVECRVDDFCHSEGCSIPKELNLS